MGLGFGSWPLLPGGLRPQHPQRRLSLTHEGTELTRGEVAGAVVVQGGPHALERLVRVRVKVRGGKLGLGLGLGSGSPVGSGLGLGLGLG